MYKYCRTYLEIKHLSERLCLMLEITLTNIQPMLINLKSFVLDPFDTVQIAFFITPLMHIKHAQIIFDKYVFMYIAIKNLTSK